MTPLRSSVESANAGDGDFPLNNLPCGVFDDGRGARMGVAIGDRVLDLRAVDHRLATLLADPSLNAVMGAGADVWTALRARLIELLADPAHRQAVAPHLIPLDRVTLQMPFRVAEFTDFYASKNHAFNVGTMFRGPEDVLPPNWLSIPLGYNGRASSVVVSGTPVRRPWGQVGRPHEALPRFDRSARFELELGAIVGHPSQGMVSVANADEMIFGYVLLNARGGRYPDPARPRPGRRVSHRVRRMFGQAPSRRRSARPGARLRADSAARDLPVAAGPGRCRP